MAAGESSRRPSAAPAPRPRAPGHCGTPGGLPGYVPLEHYPKKHRVSWGARRGPPSSSMRQRVRADLEVHDDGLLALPAFHEPRRPVAARGPEAASLPAGGRVVDAPVEALGVEAERVRDA